MEAFKYEIKLTDAPKSPALVLSGIVDEGTVRIELKGKTKMTLNEALAAVELWRILRSIEDAEHKLLEKDSILLRFGQVLQTIKVSMGENLDSNKRFVIIPIQTGY